MPVIKVILIEVAIEHLVSPTGKYCLDISKAKNKPFHNCSVIIHKLQNE